MLFGKNMFGNVMFRYFQTLMYSGILVEDKIKNSYDL
jgi:hypothetical protein